MFDSEETQISSEAIKYMVDFRNKEIEANHIRFLGMAEYGSQIVTLINTLFPQNKYSDRELFKKLDPLTNKPTFLVKKNGNISVYYATPEIPGTDANFGETNFTAHLIRVQNGGRSVRVANARYDLSKETIEDVLDKENLRYLHSFTTESSGSRSMYLVHKQVEEAIDLLQERLLEEKCGFSMFNYESRDLGNPEKINEGLKVFVDSCKKFPDEMAGSALSLGENRNYNWLDKQKIKMGLASKELRLREINGILEVTFRFGK